MAQKNTPDTRKFALSQYLADGVDNSPCLKNLTKLAAQLTNCKFALLNLINNDTHRVIACHGMELKEIPAEKSICKHLVESQEDFFEMVDPQSHAVHSSNPFVQQGIIKYYFAVPLIDKNGLRLGTLCVIDSDSHNQPTTSLVIDQIKILADQAVALFDNFRYAREIESAQERLMETSRATLINEMTHSIAHEINNPLTVLLSSVDILESNLKDAVSKKVILGMKHNIDSIKKVVAALRENNAFNNKDYGTVADIVEHSYQMVEKKFSAENVKFYMDKECSPAGKIPKSVQQVVYHLLKNAAFASLKNPGTNPEVRFKISQVNERLVLKFMDSGKGVPEDKVHTLFSGLFHSNYKGESVGIGLNTCKRIVESINGSIRFVGNDPTTFEVAVPFRLS